MALSMRRGDTGIISPICGHELCTERDRTEIVGDKTSPAVPSINTARGSKEQGPQTTLGSHTSQGVHL